MNEQLVSKTQEEVDEEAKRKLFAEIVDRGTILRKLETSYGDSLEFGTPSKGGAVKIYWDFNDYDGFRKKIDEAIRLKQYAASRLGEG